MKASPETLTHVKRQDAGFSDASHQVKGLNHCFLAREPRYFLCLLTTMEQVYSDINLIFFSLYHSSVLIHLIHSYPSLYNQTIIHWWRETGCLFQTILWANMYASAVCRIGCVVQKTISMALLQIPIEAVTKDSASHSQDKMSHKRGGKWAHLCLLEGKVPASLPFLGTLVVTVEILLGFPLSPPAAAVLLFLLRLSFFPSQTTRGREGVFR